MARCVFCQAETELNGISQTPICIVCSGEHVSKGHPDERQILDDLIQDMRDTTMRKNVASASFENAISQFPGGLPHPGGSQRIKITSTELCLARKEMLKAHNRLSEYKTNGTVPDELKGQGTG